VAHYLRTGEKLPDPSLEEQCEMVLRHYEDMISHYGVDAGYRIARKHVGWYSTGMHNSSAFRLEVNQLTDPKAVLALIRDFYAGEMEHRASKTADELGQAA
jgi:tRNA-dihydrouridine synthase B